MTGLQVVALFALGGVLVGAVSGFVWARKRRTSSWGTALVVASVPVCVYVALAVATIKTSRGDYSSWDTARLTPSVALAAGHQVYSTSSEGAVQTTMYPPMWIVSYLPVAVGSTPSQVLRVGLILTLLFSFLPVVLLLVNASPSISLAILGSTSYILASMLFGSLSYSLFFPHADAPSLGYAMLACWLTLRPGAPTTRRVASVALLAWFSVLSKQVMFPILAALPLWFLLVHGRREGIRLVGWLSVTGVGVMALMMPFFRPEGVLFNTLIVPSRIPWMGGEHPRMLVALAVGAGLVVHSIPLLILVTVGAVLSVVVRSPSLASVPGLRPFLADNPWTLLALVAVAMVPVSVLGRAKLGGDLNTISPTQYFLLAAGILAMIGVPQRLRDHIGHVSYQTSLGLTALCALVLASGGSAKVSGFAMDTPIREFRPQQAYNYLTHENSRAYFPMHPLAHLLADGSLYHLGISLYDRESLARLPLSAEQRETHLPVNPSMVCWDPVGWGEAWVKARYFTEYTQRVEVRALGPVWACYTRGT